MRRPGRVPSLISLRTPVRLALLLTALVSGTVLAGPGAVILRGSLASRGVSDLEYVADLETLTQARYAGVDGGGLMANHGEQLRVQAGFYAEAQRAARGESEPLTPLYVILDPAGDWAYARSLARFRYQVDGRSSGTITSPVLLLGEKRNYQARGGVSARSRTFNQELREDANQFWARSLEDAGKSGGSLDDAVLRGFRLILGGTDTVDMVDCADRLSVKSYLEWLEKAMVQGWDQRRMDGAGLWAQFEEESLLEVQLQAHAKRSVLDQVATSISHEMGHLVHFMAVGNQGFSLGNGPPHMNGGSHTFQTLSNPGFALVEGWAAANSMVTLGLPEPVASPGAANRIDYETTVSVIRRKRNQGLATLAARAASKLAVLPEGKPLQVPPYDSAGDAFREQLRSQLLEQGFTEEDIEALLVEEGEQAELVQLVQAEAYLSGLQERRGELRGRYDFLRSEYAVGSTLAALRIALGRSEGWLILETMARHKPLDLASLLEHFVHDFPHLRARLYQELARITEGILVTPEQAAEVGRQLASRPDLEIDLDRDGEVPGTSANLLMPALFPPEPSPLPGVEDPLLWEGSGRSLFPAEPERDGPHGGEHEPSIEREGSPEFDDPGLLPGMDDLVRY